MHPPCTLYPPPPHQLAYPIDEDDDGCVVLPCPHAPGGQVYPEEISAQIIMQLLADAVAYTGGAGIRKAVVSVPAYFNDIQREETVTAGLVAGLDTVRLVRYVLCGGYVVFGGYVLCGGYVC